MSLIIVLIALAFCVASHLSSNEFSSVTYIGLLPLLPGWNTSTKPESFSQAPKPTPNTLGKQETLVSRVRPLLLGQVMLGL